MDNKSKPIHKHISIVTYATGIIILFTVIPVGSWSWKDLWAPLPELPCDKLHLLLNNESTIHFQWIKVTKEEKLTVKQTTVGGTALKFLLEKFGDCA